MLGAVFDAFDREGISWCVLRGETDLVAPRGDIDLLVADVDLPRMCRIVRDRGFARVPAWGYGTHVFFLTYDQSGDIWLKLDVVTELAFGPGFSLATGLETQCLARRRRVGGIALLSDPDAFWALLLHRLLDKGAVIGSRDATLLNELAHQASKNGPFARFVDSVCPAGWAAERIVDEVQSGGWRTLADLAPRLAASWQHQRWIDQRRRTIVTGFWRWSGKWLALSRRRGLRVALLGPDGVGKSTLTEEVKRSFYLSARSVYMGLYKNDHHTRAGRGIPGVGLAGRLAKQWARWLEAAYHQRRGRLVLFDRYSYDALLPTPFRQSTATKVRRWLLAHSCPPPDLAIVLDAPSEILYARKGEHGEAMLERHREAYRALLQRLPRGLVVDASRHPDQVRPEVTAVIWREYARRWNKC